MGGPRTGVPGRSVLLQRRVFDSLFAGRVAVVEDYRPEGVDGLVIILEVNLVVRVFGHK